MIDSISNSYANAFIEIINESKDLIIDNAINELQLIEKIICDEKIKDFLNHPNIDTEEKQNIIKESLKNFNKNIVSFIMVLIENKSINRLSDIIESIIKYNDDLKNILKVEIITKNKLTDKEINNISLELSKKYNKKVIATNTIDKNILGGMIVKKDGMIIDNSLLSKLTSLKDSILNNR